MYQEIFRIPFIDRPVYGYGLMLVIGFMLGAQLAKFLARRCGYNGDAFINACLLGLVTGVVGARLSHVLESLADSRSTEFARNGKTLGQNLLGMLNVSSGGLTFYGGFLLATPVMIWFAIRKSIPLLRGMDIIAPCLMIGLAFGRIGCFLNGCCYGEECNPSWGVQFPYGSNAFVEQYAKGEFDVPDEFKDFTTPIPHEPAEPGHVVKNSDQLYRLLSKEEVHRKGLDQEAAKLVAKPVYPTELYSAFNSFLVAGIMIAFFTLRPPAGRVFALMLVLEGASRFILEMVRVEPAVFGTEKLSFSMFIGAGLVIAGILMWWACGKRKQRPEDLTLEAVPAM
jgi:phosphatidylglycerol:prolipoprotein diacylglycerol transferase